MRQKTLMLDLAQCEVFNHLPPMKAGVLIKAVMSYCTTGEVASWGEDVDLKPIFMSFRATLEENREEEEEKRMKGKRRNRENYLKRKGISTNSTQLNCLQETERESEREGKKRTKRKVEEGKGKEKELNKEKINITIYEKKENEQTELFEPEAAHTEAKEPQFRKPSLAEVADYVKEKGYEQWVDAEAFWSYHENGDWMVGNHKDARVQGGASEKYGTRFVSFNNFH